jgi:hypothetical protein
MLNFAKLAILAYIAILYLKLQPSINYTNVVLRSVKLIASRSTSVLPVTATMQ